MLAQNMLKQYFDASKLLEKVCTTVLLNHSRWEEQHDNKLISQQEVKLRCGIRDVNIMWGPDSKSYNLFDKQFLSRCLQDYGWWILFKSLVPGPRPKIGPSRHIEANRMSNIPNESSGPEDFRSVGILFG